MEKLCDDCSDLKNAPVGVDAHINLYTITRFPVVSQLIHVCGECDAFWEYLGGNHGAGWRKISGDPAAEH